MVVAVVAGIALIAILAYVFRDNISEALGGDEEAKEREAEKAAERDKKGAIGNTIDFLFGEGTHQRNKDKAEREGEAPQQPREMPLNVAPPNPSEPTPLEGLATWWAEGPGAFFDSLGSDNSAEPPAPPAATQGPPSESVPRGSS